MTHHWQSNAALPSRERSPSRAEILKQYLKDLSPLELLRVRPDLYALTWGWDFENNRYASGRLVHYERLERRAGFNPNQPRVPAGNSDGGQWTRDGGGGLNDPRVLSDAVESDWLPAAQYAMGRHGPRDRLPPLHFPKLGQVGVAPYRAGQVTITNNAQTGLSTIDETTEKLRAILERVVNSRAEGYGPQYGTMIHRDFGDAVKAAIRSGELRGDIRVEHTYPEAEGIRFGSKGSIRTDVVLRNDLGEVVVIYDVKTGSAYLDTRRVAQLRAKTSADLRVPIIEMHTQRGLSFKSSAAKGRYFWVITLRLWNPWYELAGVQQGDTVGF